MAISDSEPHLAERVVGSRSPTGKGGSVSATKVVLVVGLALGASGSREVAAQPVATAVAMRPIPDEIGSRYAHLRARLQPSVVEWVTAQARIEAQRPAPDLTALEGVVRARFPSTAGSGNSSVAAGVPAGEDIEALAFIVLMDATNDQNQDLQGIMSEVQAQTTAKQQIRGLEQELQQQLALLGSQSASAVCRTGICQSLEQQVSTVATTARLAGRPLRATLSLPLTAPHLSVFESQLGGDLAGMNEMSEMSSMRLQMAMDRRSKLIDTLSNILKKISDTSDAVVQNLK